jgi:hypothetical protein
MFYIECSGLIYFISFCDVADYKKISQDLSLGLVI